MEPNDGFDISYDWDREAYLEAEADSINDMCDCDMPWITCPQPGICKDKKDIDNGLL
jgi:hypothetical protein